MSNLKEQGKIPDKSFIVKTIVTGDLSRKIADQYGVEVREVLTGFKNIYAIQNEIERTGSDENFIFGYEESIGYSYGTYVRDKDAVMAAMLIAEMAGLAKKRGESILDNLNKLFEEHGYFREKLISLVRGGADGQALIGRIMDDFRKNPLQSLNGTKLEKVYDYKEEDYGIGRSNVLKYVYEDGSWYAVRPSGTEPKIKFYMYSCADTNEKSLDTLKKMEESIMQKADAVQ